MPIGLDSNKNKNKNNKKKTSWVKKIFISLVLLVILFIGFFYVGINNFSSSLKLESLYVNLHNTVWVKNNKSLSEKEEAINQLQEFDKLILPKKFLSLRTTAIVLARKKIKFDQRVSEGERSLDLIKEIKETRKRYEKWEKEFKIMQKELYETVGLDDK